MLLTVDTGTTNTRVHLLQGEVILAQKKVSAGVRNTAISGNADFLRQALRDAITDLLKEAAVSEREVSSVLASGIRQIWDSMNCRMFRRRFHCGNLPNRR